MQTLTYKSEYQAWKNARQRCTNSNRPDYKYYGGRGIEFRFSSFETFLSCVGVKPDPSFMLDRIDCNGHYEQGNVRWVPKQISNLNRQFRKAHKYNCTKVCGVYYHKSTNKYQARIPGGKSIYYGDSLEVAIKARKYWEEENGRNC